MTDGTHIANIVMLEQRFGRKWANLWKMVEAWEFGLEQYRAKENLSASDNLNITRQESRIKEIDGFAQVADELVSALLDALGAQDEQARQIRRLQHLIKCYEKYTGYNPADMEFMMAIPAPSKNLTGAEIVDLRKVVIKIKEKYTNGKND